MYVHLQVWWSGILDDIGVIVAQSHYDIEKFTTG